MDDLKKKCMDNILKYKNYNTPQEKNIYLKSKLALEVIENKIIGDGKK